MNKTLILQLNKHNIYLLSDNNISFYISIPTAPEFNATNISIDIKSDFIKIDTTKNDIVYVKDEISNIYSDIDNENITLIIPVFNNNILELLKKNPTEELYVYLDKCISYVINNAYKYLTANNIQVNTKIIIINNEKYDGFIKWFASRYSSRIDTKQYSELLGEFTSVIPVVSKEQISNIDIGNNITVNTSESKSTGFISYILLGTIAIVLTLIILYILL